MAIVTGDISGTRKTLVETRAEVPAREWIDDRSHPEATEVQERTIGSDGGSSEGGSNDDGSNEGGSNDDGSNEGGISDGVRGDVANVADVRRLVETTAPTHRRLEEMANTAGRETHPPILVRFPTISFLHQD